MISKYDEAAMEMARQFLPNEHAIGLSCPRDAIHILGIQRDNARDEVANLRKAVNLLRNQRQAVWAKIRELQEVVKRLIK